MTFFLSFFYFLFFLNSLGSMNTCSAVKTSLEDGDQGLGFVYFGFPYYSNLPAFIHAFSYFSHIRFCYDYSVYPIIYGRTDLNISRLP